MNTMLPALGGGTMGMSPSMYRAKRMSVVKLIVQRSGTYGQQYRRPLISTGSGAAINEIETVLHNNSNLTPVSLAKSAFELLKPNATPEAPVVIENGWQEERLRFLLHVSIEDQMGFVTNHYYTGFTQFSDLSHSGQIDPNMVFTINSVSSTKAVQIRSATGIQLLQQPIASAQMIMPNPGSTAVADPNKLFSLMPETVVDEIMNADLRNAVDPNQTFLNASAYFTAPTRSNRRNSIAPDYLNQLVTGYRNVILNPSSEYDSNDAVLENVKQVMQASSNTDDQFLGWLQGRRIETGGAFGLRGGMLADNQFTINDLMRFDDQVMTKIRSANVPGMVNNVHSAQMSGTSNWGASSAEVQYATILSQSLPAYLSQFQLTRLGISSSNEIAHTGEIVTTFTNVMSYNNSSYMAPVLEALRSRLNTELFFALSYGNKMNYRCDVQCDLNGETWITISMGGGPDVPFCCPTFCDSLFSSVATTDQNKQLGMARDFQQLFEVVNNYVHTVSGSSTLGATSDRQILNMPTIGGGASAGPAVIGGGAPSAGPSIGGPSFNTPSGNNPGF